MRRKGSFALAIFSAWRAQHVTSLTWIVSKGPTSRSGTLSPFHLSTRWTRGTGGGAAAAAAAAAEGDAEGDLPPSLFDSLEKNDAEGVRKYAEAGYGCNVADAFGMPAMNHAAARGNVEAMKIMAGAGARADHANFHGGETPLHEASARGHLDAVRFLVSDLGAEVDAQNNLGDTPLSVACFWGHVETVKFLLQAGANPGIFNENGKCAGQEFDFILLVENQEGASRKDQVVQLLEEERQVRGMQALGPIDDSPLPMGGGGNVGGLPGTL